MRPGGAAAPAPRVAGGAARARSSRPSAARWPLPARPGRASTATPPPAPGSSACARSSCRCRALALPAELWEREVLPRRVGAYSTELARPALRRRRDRLGRRRGDRPPLGPRRALLPRRRSGDRAAGSRGQARRPGRARARADPRAAAARRPASSATCSPRSSAPVEALQEALWDLVWAGEVTNDAWAPLRAPRLALRAAARRRHALANRARGGASRPAVRASRAQTRAPVQGRWSLVAPLFDAAADPVGAPARARRAAARALRHPHPRAGARRGHRRRLRGAL